MRCITLGKVIVICILLFIVSFILPSPFDTVTKIAPSILILWWIVGLVAKCNSYV